MGNEIIASVSLNTIQYVNKYDVRLKVRGV